ncbi:MULTISPECIES: Holliday junction branch migration protein RuvA [Terrabacteria group]|uniref:Holliday junction branch migration protein RuvA n=1 Tax=Bacillati TaxID=1783272 RepID=UPI001939F7F3|nr:MULTISPECIES: Holliday junction branch migration protein RuvA [Terrabacteria group]MBW9211908.1 Holliday junction branch migration protein RuvA [Trueperella sp. zg.1013]QRG87290.1 Holliday junction branch migration protein RuvA [Bulleidia sp. zg-1006]
MIAFIQGVITEIGDDYIVINRQGIGWLIYYPHCLEVHQGEEVQVFTYMSVSENDMRLYGFSTAEEKSLFLNLISVKGLGPKTAMTLLQKSGYDLITAAISKGDVAALKKLPGIGAKSASQIVLDLQGKLIAVDTASTKAMNYPLEIQEALEALKNFGYKGGDLNLVGNKMLEQASMTTEEYIRFGLKFFASH